MGNRRTELNGLRDRCWADVATSYNDIKRIADEGPSKPDDIKLILVVFNVMLGELAFRMIDQMEGIQVIEPWITLPYTLDNCQTEDIKLIKQVLAFWWDDSNIPRNSETDMHIYAALQRMEWE